MIDFRSDTVTKPTKAMREAMKNAIVGDDVYGDDPTLNELEILAAKLLGKEKALFLPSGTMANQVAIMTHTQPGDEIILGQHCHIKNYEVGAASALSGVGYSLLDDHQGFLDHEALHNHIRGDNIHFPKTALICSETAHSLGVVAPLEKLKAIHHIAKKHNIPHHLDGARIFNAALSLGIEAKAIAQYADSIMFCLSKGLSSPIGSILVGDTEFIEKARKYRKMLGGGMRQAGVLAACGLISLNTMRHRLNNDHDNAAYLAEALNATKEFEIAYNQRDINMVFVKSTLDMENYKAFMEKEGILLGGYKGAYMRLMTHNDIDKAAIDTFIEKTKAYLKTR